jgi:Pyruvate/2-oxoacid:ferredoxin oxidoreductase delta subunit
MKTIFRQKLQQFQRDNQTLPLGNTSFFKKIIVLIYKLLGRKIIGRLLISSSQCNSCHRCESVCPNHAIRFTLNNPRRNKKCKGCLLCVHQCPRNAIEIPLVRLFGAFALIFLPFDQWIGKLFSFSFSSMNIKDQLLSLALWFVGYAIAVVLLEEITFFLNMIPMIKRIGEIPFIKKLRSEIHPALIFPVMLPK